MLDIREREREIDDKDIIDLPDMRTLPAGRLPRPLPLMPRPLPLRPTANLPTPNLLEWLTTMIGDDW